MVFLYSTDWGGNLNIQYVFDIYFTCYTHVIHVIGTYILMCVECYQFIIISFKLI